LVDPLGRTATRRYLTLDDTAVLSARKFKNKILPPLGLCVACHDPGQGVGVGWPGLAAELLAQAPVFA